MQFLYESDGLYHFMDNQSFEQVTLTRDQLDEALPFLTENLDCEVISYEGAPIGVELPSAVELTISNTEPGFKGDTAQGGTKQATLETGAVVQVPLFIERGERVKVDTRTGQYLSRV
jgi:elongation factor P